MMPPRTNQPGGGQAGGSGPGTRRAGGRWSRARRDKADPQGTPRSDNHRSAGTSPLSDPEDTTDPLPAEERQIRTTFLRLRGTADALLAAADAGRSAATGAYEIAERDAARRTHRAVQKAEADADNAYEEARDTLANRVGRIAPFAASADWDAPGWRSDDWLGTGPARYVRIGSLSVPGADPRQSGAHPDQLPALVPLLDVGSLGLIAEGDDKDWPIRTMHSVLLRALAAAPPGRLEIVTYDPRIRGVTSPFAALRKAGNDLLADPLATPNELLARLTLLRAAVMRVAELAGAHGVPDLATLTEVTGVQPEPYRLVVVCDYPYGVDSRAQTELIRLAEGGPHRGVSLLVHHDPRVVPDDGVNPAELLRHLNVARGRNSAITVNALPAVTVRPDQPPPRELIERVSARVAEGARRGAAPVVEFEPLLPEPDKLWTEDAIRGMTAKIGRAGLDTVELELRGSDPSLPNVLIGGASGQGKSNLLLVLLHSIAASYSPDEVAMFLLDFKDGLEFDRLGPRPGRPWHLPHARVLGLEGDRAFGLAVLRYLDGEFRRRAEQFRLAGANDLAGYRTLRPNETVPRLLLVIDEFQVLVAEDDDIARASIVILETLARRGRAVGVHLVLASQTLSGIETLVTKERSIFGQFPWRVSLKTEASESEAVLGRQNTEAAQLRFRGEIVFNREYGDPAHNRRGVVAYADEQRLDALRRTLWEKAGRPAAPRVFYAARPSDPNLLTAALQRVLTDAPPGDDTKFALLGLPVDVDPAPVAFGLTADPGRTLAVVGDGRDDAFGTLGAVVWSLAAQHVRGGAEFVLLDAVGGDAGSPETALLAEAAGAYDHGVTRYTGGAVGGGLSELARIVDERIASGGKHADLTAERRPIYVLGIGLHRAARLDHYDDTGTVPTDALRTLVREGPLVDVHLIGWWNSLRVFSEHVGYEYAPLVGGYVFLRVPEADVQGVLGPYLRYQAQLHRGLFCDLSHGGRPVPVVPFGLPERGR
ncbi:FtsK/SpoIIIE domain-containing protein [Cryptosporangium aurantiacum]|uniref:FtsK/SpoIIIE family protein n=1 Tax=Cryptosporangium aurantiacum TaxID=134849 RepID=A0A1M7RE52_9ACTN|nr:FtsK/SpoIIIE domain-containing protein [Cryptosporangium aurantiacum]SHN44603.1 FtsK/SpoIIIE family protein [Cryptosporangium aurantiacum]